MDAPLEFARNKLHRDDFARRIITTPGALRMLPKNNPNWKGEDAPQPTLESLLKRVRELERYTYSKRLRHIKRIAKYREIMHEMVDSAIHDSFQIFEKELHHYCCNMRELEKNLSKLVEEFESCS